ncbi:MAG: pyridoxal phosphate-dependent decarboxylase family protein [Nanobdellota archaeon]
MIDSLKEIYDHFKGDHDGAMPDISLKEEGVDFKTLISEFKNINAHTPRVASNRYFSQLFNGEDKVAQMADMISSVYNMPMHTYKASGIHEDIEKEVINFINRYTGHQDGIITPGGTIADMMAMIMARNDNNWETKDEGIGAGRYMVYASQIAHYALTRGANVIGIGRNNVRKVPVDEKGKMRTGKLKEMIEEDLDKGHIPMMINATAGTTITGTYDNIDEISRIARKFDIWFHVDGAFGGTLIFDERRNNILKGLENADSFSWDAHKMLGLPIPSSVFVTRKRVLKESLYEHVPYLFGRGDDQGYKSIQCARRNNALKIWAYFKYYGVKGIKERLDKQFGNVRYAVEFIRNHPKMNLVLEPELVNVCFTIEGKDSTEVCRKAEDKGIKINSGYHNGQEVIKIVLVNPELEKKDIDYVFNALIDLS